MGSERRSEKRLPGPMVAAGLIAVVLAVVVLAIGLFLAGQKPRGPILSLRAVRGGHALVLRRGFQARKTVHLARYDRRGRLVWSEALFGAQPEGVPFLAGDRVIVPAREARGHPATHVFRFDDGSFVFRGEPAPASVSTDATARYAAGEGRLFELYRGDPGRLAAYDLETGALAYSIDIPQGEADVTFAGGALIVEGEARLAFDPATGAAIAAAATPSFPPRPVASMSEDGCVRVRLASGASRAAVVRVEDHVLLPLRPEHVAEDVLFVRTDRDLVGLALPDLVLPPGYDGPLQVSSARGACAPRAR